ADPAARRATTLTTILILDEDPVELVDAVDAEQAEIETFEAIGAAAVVDDRIPAPLRRRQQLVGRNPLLVGRCGFLAADLSQFDHYWSGRLLACLTPLAAFGRNAADLGDEHFVIFRVTQVEAVDVAVGHVDGADSLRRWGRFVLVLVEIFGGLELAF